MGNHTQPVSKKQKLPHKKQDVESTGLPRVEIKGSTRFPWPLPEAALWVLSSKLFLKKQSFEKDFIKTNEIAVKAES